MMEFKNETLRRDVVNNNINNIVDIKIKKVRDKFWLTFGDNPYSSYLYENYCEIENDKKNLLKKFG